MERRLQALSHGFWTKVLIAVSVFGLHDGDGQVNRLLMSLIDDYADPFKPRPAVQNAQNADGDVQRWQDIIDRILEEA